MDNSGSSIMLLYSRLKMEQTRRTGRWAVMALASCLFLTGASLFPVPDVVNSKEPAISIPQKEREAMKVAQHAGTQPEMMVSSVEASAPGHIETATFALG